MAKRKPIIAGNWKMYKTVTETKELIEQLVEGLSDRQLDCDVVIAPPFTALDEAHKAIRGSGIRLAGQNLFWRDEGAFTGEISGNMLKEVGCTHVILGHSERRQIFGETDETINLKIAAALRNDLIPIVCVGETLEEREKGVTFEVVRRQLRQGLESIEIKAPGFCVVAYEPVWAIGTGRTASSEQAQEVHAFLRHELKEMKGNDFADGVKILYGGSVKPENSRDLIGKEDIDGALVGGASLKATDFCGIIEQGTR